jgi:hypothetical protein
MLLTGDSGPCRFNTLNVSVDTCGEPLPTRPGDCYFAADCSRCYYSCVWEPTFLLSASLPEHLSHAARLAPLYFSRAAAHDK